MKIRNKKTGAIIISSTLQHIPKKSEEIKSIYGDVITIKTEEHYRDKYIKVKDDFGDLCDLNLDWRDWEEITEDEKHDFSDYEGVHI